MENLVGRVVKGGGSGGGWHIVESASCQSGFSSIRRGVSFSREGIHFYGIQQPVFLRFPRCATSFNRRQQWHTRRIESIHSSQASNNEVASYSRAKERSSIFLCSLLFPHCIFFFSVSFLSPSLFLCLFTLLARCSFLLFHVFFFFSSFSPRPVLPGFVLCSPRSSRAGRQFENVSFSRRSDNASRERRKAHAEVSLVARGKYAFSRAGRQLSSR